MLLSNSNQLGVSQAPRNKLSDQALAQHYASLQQNTSQAGGGQQQMSMPNYNMIKQFMPQSGGAAAGGSSGAGLMGGGAAGTTPGFGLGSPLVSGSMGSASYAGGTGAAAGGVVGGVVAKGKMSSWKYT